MLPSSRNMEGGMEAARGTKGRNEGPEPSGWMTEAVLFARAMMLPAFAQDTADAMRVSSVRSAAEACSWEARLRMFACCMLKREQAGVAASSVVASSRIWGCKLATKWVSTLRKSSARAATARGV